MFQALKFGAQGYLFKEIYQQVLLQVSQDATDKEITKPLTISLNTVKRHIRNIVAKLHVPTRREAAKVVRNKGMV